MLMLNWVRSFVLMPFRFTAEAFEKCCIIVITLLFLGLQNIVREAENMSKRKALLDAACKENVEDFLRFIGLHVSSYPPTAKAKSFLSVNSLARLSLQDLVKPRP